MQTRSALIVVGVLIVIIGVYAVLSKGSTATDTTTPPAPLVENAPTGNTTPPAVDGVSNIKEFNSTAFYDAQGAWYSLKEMTVKKGDTVRVTVTNTKGTHDFVIDEFGVKKDLPLNEPVVIEFIADKVGDFVYYCSKMDHRAKGQWGTLHVTE